MKAQTLRVIDGEKEKFCHKCQEWWPATTEYFYPSTEYKWVLHSPCKACVAEKRRQTNSVKCCCVPGCTNPRDNWRYSRCREHRYYEAIAKPRRVEASQES